MCLVFFVKVVLLDERVGLCVIVDSTEHEPDATDEICNDDRKIWIKQLKKDMERDFVNPVFSDKECMAELIVHNGISMEQHLQTLAEVKRDDFKNNSTREERDFLRSLFFDIDDSQNK